MCQWSQTSQIKIELWNIESEVCFVWKLFQNKKKTFYFLNKLGIKIFIKLTECLWILNLHQLFLLFLCCCVSRKEKVFKLLIIFLMQIRCFLFINLNLFGSFYELLRIPLIFNQTLLRRTAVVNSAFVVGFRFKQIKHLQIFA